MSSRIDPGRIRGRRMCCRCRTCWIWRVPPLADATRYDKLPKVFEGGIDLASARIWL